MSFTKIHIMTDPNHRDLTTTWVIDSFLFGHVILLRFKPFSICSFGEIYLFPSLIRLSMESSHIQKSSSSSDNDIIIFRLSEILRRRTLRKIHYMILILKNLLIDSCCTLTSHWQLFFRLFFLRVFSWRSFLFMIMRIVIETDSNAIYFEVFVFLTSVFFQ